MLVLNHQLSSSGMLKVSAKHTSLSQKIARDSLSNTELFSGGTYITRNGITELFIQPATEREQELAQQEAERQSHALLKMTLMAKSDIANNNTMTLDSALSKLKAARK